MKMRAVFLVAIAAYGLFSCKNAEDIVVPKTVTETARFVLPQESVQGVCTQSYVSEGPSGSESTPILLLPSSAMVFDTVGVDTTYSFDLALSLQFVGDASIPLLDSALLRFENIQSDSALIVADNRTDGENTPAGRVHVTFPDRAPFSIDPFVGEPINHIECRLWKQNDNTLMLSLFFESDNGTLSLPDPGRLVVDGRLNIDLSQAEVVVEHIE